MKKAAGIFVVFLLAVILAINATALPKLNGYVNDYANIIEPNYESEINNLITETEKNTTAEIAVVMVESLEGLAIEEYAVKLFEENKIGKKDKNNGVLILVAIEERQYRVEVGYGLEDKIVDAYKVRIGTRILEPYLKQGKYGEGVYLAVKEISTIVHGEFPDIILKKPIREILHNETISILIVIFGIIFILSFAFATARQHGYPMFFPPTGGFGGSSGGFGGFGGGMSGGGGFSGKF